MILNWKTVLCGTALVVSNFSFGNPDSPFAAGRKPQSSNSVRLGFSFLSTITNINSGIEGSSHSMNALPAFSAGISLYGDVGRHLSVESGVMLTRWNYRTSEITFLPPEGSHVPADQTDNPFLNENEVYSIDRYHYIETPLVLSYKKRFKNFRVELGGGASAAIRMYEAGRAYDFTTDEHFQNYTNNSFGNKVQIRWIARLGLEYKVSDYFSVRLDPTYQHDITKFEPAYDQVTNSRGSTGKMYSYGIKFGLISNLSFGRRNS